MTNERRERLNEMARLRAIERRAMEAGKTAPQDAEYMDVPSPFTPVQPPESPFKSVTPQRSQEEIAELGRIARQTGYSGGAQAGFSPAAQDTLKEILSVLKEISGKLPQQSTYSA